MRLDDVSDEVVGQLGDLGAVGAEAFGAGVVDAESGHLDARLVHRLELRIDVHVPFADTPVPLSRNGVERTVLFVGAGDVVTGRHELEDGAGVHVALDIDAKRAAGFGRALGWCGASSGHCRASGNEFAAAGQRLFCFRH